tara:strand:- start:9428 stop:11002 length:1575 start_codon:yes stop_codon:yes gene_type:complete
MSRVLTNNVGLQYAVETSIGTLPGSPEWHTLEPNSLGTYGADITTTERRPIAAQRGRKKGAVVDLASAAEFDADLTMDAFTDFAEGFVFSEYANVEFDLKSTGGVVPPPVASSTTWTVESVTALLGGKLMDPVTGTAPLLFAKGYTNAANNGLHALSTDAASTDVILTTGSTLVTETPAVNASLQVAGVRSAIADLALTVSGSTATLVSAADIADWSVIGLFVGQYIHIGSPTTAGVVQNGMGTGTDIYGYARITSISSATLNLDKLSSTLATDAANSTLTDVMFGRFLRNVEISADSDDNRYLERTYQFEAAYPDLGGAGTDEYEYAIGNFANSLALNIPLTEKATATWGFVGTNSDDITPTRKTNAASAVNPLRTTAVNTSSDIVSISTDVISLASDVCFKSLTLTIANNVSPEKCIGTLGASFVNAGLYEVNLDGQLMFTNKSIVNAVKNNTTVTFSAIFRNDDGAVALDIPSLTFGGAGREFPVDASVLVNLTGLAFNDPSGTVPNVSLGISQFAAVPYA